MALFRFSKDFDWWGHPRNCKLCKLALWAFKRTPDDHEPIEIPEAAADAAEAAGAGKRVNYEAMQQ